MNGDVYLNPFFGDLWIVVNDTQIRKINDSYTEDFDNVIGFKKVGHIDLWECYHFLMEFVVDI